MKANDLRERTTEDLLELERSLAFDTFQNRFKNFTNRLDDTSMIRKSRRDLARVKGILAERGRALALKKLEGAAQAEAAKPAAVEAAPAKPEVQAAPAAEPVAAPKAEASEAKAPAAEKKAPKAKSSSKKGKPASGEGESK